MSEFELWIISHWVTLLAAGLLLINLAIAAKTNNKHILIGASGLILFWTMTVASLMLFEEVESAWPRFFIDAGAVVFFYRLSEKNANGDRHDWAALICFAYFWLCVMDIYSALSERNLENGYVAASNVIFVAKILFNLIPSIFILTKRRPLLVTREHPQSETN